MNTKREDVHPSFGTDEKVQCARPHSTFYLSGNVVVFEVQDVLFKIDSAMLKNGEDSAFKTMLSLPQDVDGRQEGANDSNPIRLQDDSPEEFASLIWGLYSQNLSRAEVAAEGTTRFIQIAKMAHKYDLRHLEGWSTAGLSRLAHNDFGVRKSQAAPLLEVFALCNSKGAIELMVSTIKGMLHEKVCSTTQITAFIHIGYKFGLASLVGLGYYAIMLKPRCEWESVPSLTLAHRIRLLNGYYMLSEYSLMPIIKAMAGELSQYHGAWREAWTLFAVASKDNELRTANELRTVDIIGRSRSLLEDFLAKNPSVTGDVAHKSIFRVALEKLIDDLVEKEFPKYFADLSLPV